MKIYFVVYVRSFKGEVSTWNTSVQHPGIRSIHDVKKLEEQIRYGGGDDTHITITNWIPFETG